MTAIDTGPYAPTPAERLIFSATITPHRSLGKKGVTLVVGGVALVSLITALPFILMGAWPIGGFLGLDVLLLYGAFRYNNGKAREYEELFLSSMQLVFSKTSWRGKTRVWSFNPRWVRLTHEEDPDYGMINLRLQEGNNCAPVGTFLPPCEREDFAGALRRALAEARRG